MVGTLLRELLERNDRHVDSLDDGHFAAVRDGQHPPVVAMCCPDARVPQTAMWDVDEPGWLFTPSTVGNQVWDSIDGERVVDGSVHYPLAYTGTEVAAVVGHTDCGAVSAALEAVRGADEPAPAGVDKWLRLLAPVIEAGLADDRVEPAADTPLVDQLAEYNVDRQVAFLRERLGTDVTVYGFMYDLHGTYGATDGRAYLVNADGATDPDALRAAVPSTADDHVRRLL